MARTGFHLGNAKAAVWAAGVAIAAFSMNAPAALAEDAYPPGWNVRSNVPPSATSTWIGGYNTNLPYWANQERPTGHIPSRYSPDQCQWDWCRSMVQR